MARPGHAPPSAVHGLASELRGARRRGGARASSGAPLGGARRLLPGRRRRRPRARRAQGPSAAAPGSRTAPCWRWPRSGLGGAVAIGIAGLFVVSASLAPFVVAGALMVLAYNLELFGGRFHTDFWFAAAWGAFPALTGFWVNALGIDSLGEAAAGVLRDRRLLRPQRRPAPPLDPGARAAPQDGRGQRRAAARRRHHARAHRRPPRRPAGRRPGGALRGARRCWPPPWSSIRL